MTIPPTKTEAAVLAVIESMTDAFHRGDLDGVIAMYDPDAVVVFEPGITSQGLPAIREGFLGFFGVKPRFDYAGHGVTVADGLAVHIAPWTMTGTAPDGSEITGRGLSVAVLRQNASGDWRLVIDDPYGDLVLQG